MDNLHFEWSPDKARRNKLKHGVSFDEASTVFRDVWSRTIHDPDHSFEEDRFVTTGLSTARRLLVVVHTDRCSGIRLISARIATAQERTVYEERTEKTN